MEKPTVRWRNFLVALKAEAEASGEEAGPQLFTDFGIARAEDILEEYKANLKKIKGRNDSQAIMKEVEQVILKLNELTAENGIAPSIIETQEREELCEFIDFWAKDAGLVIDEGDDISEEWRDW